MESERKYRKTVVLGHRVADQQLILDLFCAECYRHVNQPRELCCCPFLASDCARWNTNEPP